MMEPLDQTNNFDQEIVNNHNGKKIKKISGKAKQKNLQMRLEDFLKFLLEERHWLL